MMLAIIILAIYVPLSLTAIAYLIFAVRRFGSLAVELLAEKATGMWDTRIDRNEVI